MEYNEYINDVNEALQRWYPLFSSILGTYAPLKARRVKRPQKSDSISKAIKTRNNLHRQGLPQNNDAYISSRS